MPFLSIFLTSLLTLYLPGMAILLWLGNLKRGFAEILADAIGLSIATTTLVYLASFYLPIQARLPFWIVFYLVFAILAFIGIYRLKPRLRWSWEIPATLAILALILALRSYQIRDLVLPAWVDSVHHALITRVILERGAIPSTLAPYLDVPFSYYFGFHGLAATFSLISGLSPENAILAFGQVLNAMIPLAIYRFGRALWKDRSRPLMAALLVAFVSQMPAYYASWGRYTLLTGMLMLPITMATFLDGFQESASLLRATRLALLVAGLVLAHYFAGILFLGFVLLSLILPSADRMSPMHRTGLSSLWPITIGFLLVGPWLFRAVQLGNYGLSSGFVLPIIGDSELSSRAYAVYLLHLTRPLRNQIFLVFGLVGLIGSLRDRSLRNLAIWGCLLVLASLPSGVELPSLRPDQVLITLFLPMAFGAAELMDRIITSLHSFWNQKYPNLYLERLLTLVTWIPCLGWLAWGLIESRNIVNQSSILVRPQELQAISWAGENLPVDARVLINATTWQGSVNRGVDGGFWLLPLTGRFTIPPPVIYAWKDPAEVHAMNELTMRVTHLTGCDQEFWQLIKDGSITHIYLRDDIGSLQARALATCQGLQTIYQSGGVTILSVASP